MKKLSVIVTLLMLISVGAMASELGHNMNSIKEYSASVEHDAGSVMGSPGIADDISRTVEIIMDDTMRFTPQIINVKQGETVRFLIQNDGKATHEFVLGTTSQLKEHAGMMQQMKMQHNMPNMISLAPTKGGEVIWKFDQAGRVSFACLVPGHMEAGMVGEVNIQ
ncbi:cupredoxin family protein [Aeromonas enteropelogenes]|uniref:cupredoxin family protein n=1 Tax=Aeromonas enteropelogenes TaxID=29489 RepID=UPI003B9F52F5